MRPLEVVSRWLSVVGSPARRGNRDRNSLSRWVAGCFCWQAGGSGQRAWWVRDAALTAVPYATTGAHSTQGHFSRGNSAPPLPVAWVSEGRAFRGSVVEWGPEKGTSHEIQLLEGNCLLLMETRRMNRV